MTHIDTTTTTGKERSPRRKSGPATPSELLIKLRDRNPNMPQDEIEELHWQGSADNDAFLREYHRQWFSLNYNKLTQSPEKRHQRTAEERRAQRAQRAEAVNAGVERLKKAAIRIALLEWVTPLGKKFGKCNADECRELVPLLGDLASLAASVAAQLKPGQMVEQRFSEKQLQKAYRADT